MRLRVSLPDDDVEFLDSYAAENNAGSRSAVVRKAVRLLRVSELGSDYEAAWGDWSDTGEDSLWDMTGADGVD